ncbi:MAG: dihydrofolate reductase [Bacteroidetes bacterium]|nr:dihydrofolate reductase [Bacteroidota bacterium]
MSKVVLEITMSLDGFIAGSNISRELPMGEGGNLLHQWLFNLKTDQDAIILDELMKNTGALILGNRTYATAIDDAWGGTSPFSAPAFVLAHKTPKEIVDGFVFVTDGIESALTKAKAIAGDKIIWVMGGANVMQQFLKSGLIDELNIHIAPLLFAKGTRLFDFIGNEKIALEKIMVKDTPGATHLKYKISRLGR